MLSAAAGATAEPREPLAVTQLRDPEFMLQPSAVSGSTDDAIAPGNIDGFSRAISEAVRLQRQSTDARCQLANRGTGSVAAQWAWEAHCRYQRY